MALIGLGGLLASGKDEVADRLVSTHGWIKLNMSDPLVEAMSALNPIIVVPGPESDPSDDLPSDSTVWRFNDLLERWGYVEAKTVPEVRRLLQALGTDVGRNMIDPNVWVSIARKNIESLQSEDKNVVITGLRFDQEIEMVSSLGGKTIWVDRPNYVREGSTSTHASETSVSVDDFEATLLNDGTLEDLYRKVDLLYK